MHLKSLTIFCCLTIASLCWGMDSSFTKPANSLPRVRFATQNLNSFDIQFVRGKANQSFNEFEQEVPLLSFHGPEDLLNRFIDSDLPYDDTTTVGQAFFDGELRIFEYGLTFNKNFSNNVYVSCAANISNTKFKNITVLPVSNTCRLLSEEEIDSDTNLKNYLTTLQTELINDCNHSCYNLGPLFCSLGYAKNYQHFEHADFVDISFQAGIALPPYNVNNNRLEQEQTFKAPTYQRVNIGIPIQASVEAGFYEWLNVSATGLVMPFFSNDTMMRLNPTETNNILLSNDFVLTKVQQYPFVYFDAYIAADELVPKAVLILGCSYAKQFKTVYTPQDTEKYDPDIVNQYSLHKPWNLLNLNFEAEFVFATEHKPSYPRFKFVYIYPLHGQSVYKTSLLNGQVGLDISYKF